MFSIISCNDDDEVVVTPQQEKTIAGLVSSDPDYSILVTALTRTNLVGTLDGTGQFTVFAPNNAAFNTFFASLGATVNVNNVNVDVLKNVLLISLMVD